MKYLIKISGLCLVFIAAALPVTIANGPSSDSIAKKSYVHQPLPDMPKVSAPKVKNIVFSAQTDIDPIITGPRR